MASFGEASVIAVVFASLAIMLGILVVNLLQVMTCNLDD